VSLTHYTFFDCLRIDLYVDSEGQTQTVAMGA